MKRLEDSSLLYRTLSPVDADALYKKYPELPKDFMVACPTCHKNMGAGRDGTFFYEGETWECNCRDQLQRHKHYLNAGIGDIYQRLQESDFVGDMSALQVVGDYISHEEKYIELGMGIMFVGGNGTGKTFLLSLALKQLIRHGYPCYFTTFVNLMNMIKGTWDSRADKEEYKRKIAAAQILVIDDMGKEYMKSGLLGDSFASATFDSIIRERVQNARPTFVTTNMNVEQFAAQYGGSVVSLIKECSVVFEVNGIDYRDTIRQRRIADANAGIRRPIF